MARFTQLMRSLAVSTAFAPVCLSAQTFTFAPEKPAVTNINVAVTGPQLTDINGDGKTDLVVLTNNGFEAYLGDGAGNFAKTPLALDNFWSLTLSVPQSQLINETYLVPQFIDVNGDGKADMVWGYPSFADEENNGNEAYRGSFAVALGDGNGHFTLTTDLSIENAGWHLTVYAFSLVSGDFNGDGKTDFALITSGDDSTYPAILVFLNKGSGIFDQQPTITLGGVTNAFLKVGDFNGDGKLDLAWVHQDQNGYPVNNVIPTYSIEYKYGQGDGTFGATQTYTIDAQPVGLAAADLNHDGKADLVVGLLPKSDVKGVPLPGATSRIATLRAKQAGGFYWYTAVNSVAPPSALALLDLNGDGILDLNYQANFLRAGLGGGSFGPAQFVTGTAWDFPPTYPSPLYVSLPFAPLVSSGGLPDLFDPDFPSAVNMRVNNSRK